MKTLITGGARSGKSAYALAMAEQSPGAKVFIATAEARDAEMRARIVKHKAERGPCWITVEEPLNVAEAVAAHGAAGNFIVIDCLTLWTSNLLEGADNAAFAKKADELAGAVAGVAAAVIVVTNEVGLGIVPGDPLSRAYRDRLGLVNARLAAVCGRVILMVAGLPLMIKGK
ncbi:MAG: bifunctional adenosylcobinamide kinase/adenosylcobinamide-phosphate guanylyltransferase [Candidatus Nitrosotenuis sp.]|nr:MAG: bifunctional adenosylcobinamide kinase/adenosylcobinamide-phosphate guanylyltransferase [Candidatus Nitrosotenuis sp.]